jgi:hypothetical protein
MSAMLRPVRKGWRELSRFWAGSPKNKLIATLVIVSLLVNLIPIAGFVRAMPIPDGKGGVIPFGSFFPGTPLYTAKILNGNIIDYCIWAAGRFVHQENVYDMKDRLYPGDFFPYPPLLVFIGYLISPFQPFQYYVWVWVLIGAIAIICKITNELLKERGIGKTERWIVLLLIVTGQGVIRALGWGHYYLIVLAMMFVVYWYLDRNEWVAAIAAGILNSMILYGLILIPYFFIKRKWRAMFMTVFMPALFLYILFLTNKPSFYNFFPFLVKANNFGIINTPGSFSLVRILHNLPFAGMAYLALNAIIFGAVTLAYWQSKSGRTRGKAIPMISDAEYFVFLQIFLLVTESWFSGHHSIVGLLAYVLLYDRLASVPYFLTEANYHTFFGMALVAGYVLYTYFVFLGILLVYVYLLVRLFKPTVALAKAAGKRVRGMLA